MADTMATGTINNDDPENSAPDCDGSPTVDISGDTVGVETKGTYVVVYSATDSANNRASATRTVNVLDTATSPRTTDESLTAEPMTANRYLPGEIPRWRSE